MIDIIYWITHQAQWRIWSGLTTMAICWVFYPKLKGNYSDNYPDSPLP